MAGWKELAKKDFVFNIQNHLLLRMMNQIRWLVHVPTNALRKIRHFLEQLELWWWGELAQCLYSRKVMFI